FLICRRAREDTPSGWVFQQRLTSRCGSTARCGSARRRYTTATARSTSFEREREHEDGAAARPVGGADASAQPLHRASSEPEPQAGAAGTLGRKERFEKAGLDRRRKARAFVRHRDDQRIP